MQLNFIAAVFGSFARSFESKCSHCISGFAIDRSIVIAFI